MLATGSVIGAGANVFGTVAPQVRAAVRVGDDGPAMTEDGFLTVAERVLARRNVEWTETRRDSLRQTYRRGTRG